VGFYPSCTPEMLFRNYSGRFIASAVRSMVGLAVQPPGPCCLAPRPLPSPGSVLLRYRGGVQRGPRCR